MCAFICNKGETAHSYAVVVVKCSETIRVRIRTSRWECSRAREHAVPRVTRVRVRPAPMRLAAGDAAIDTDQKSIPNSTGAASELDKDKAPRVSSPQTANRKTAYSLLP